MIENVPTAEELRTVSLRLYFKAWAEITEIVTEWERFSGLDRPEWSPEKGHFYVSVEGPGGDDVTQEWRQYIEGAQSDLQGIYTLIQQSQEIGLKARICEVSPYLLLKRTDVKPTNASNFTWDFTDFPTVDAADLVRIHNTFCSTVLSKDFQIQYDEIRRNRNKISHLGIYRQRIDPQVIIDILRMHYVELYPGRRWMEDRLHFATLHRWADYVDNDYNHRTALYEELWHLLPGLSDAQFNWLMGHDRDTPRYICFSCAQDARLGGNEPYDSDVPTAYTTDKEFEVHCVICNEVYPTKLGKCANNECSCELLSADMEGVSESEGKCMRCGWDDESWQDHLVRKQKQKDDLAQFIVKLGEEKLT